MSGWARMGSLAQHRLNKAKTAPRIGSASSWGATGRRSRLAKSKTASDATGAPAPAGTGPADPQAQPLDVPMDSGLMSMKIRLGLKDKTPTKWSGSFELAQGRVIATDGWRFMGNDTVTATTFSIQSRRWRGTSWPKRHATGLSSSGQASRTHTSPT